MENNASRRNFIEKTDVSRETMDRLDVYAALLKKWNPAINLVSKGTIESLWSRHFLDSAQLLALAPPHFEHWVDIGSGGGFPGLVVAIMAQDCHEGAKFTLIESDQRKATFLRTVSRETKIPVTVLTDRIESAPPQNADILSARALAPLHVLLGFAERHLKHNGRTFFMKGATSRQEMQEALESWTFQSEEYPSITDASAVILSLGDIKRV